MKLINGIAILSICGASIACGEDAGDDSMPSTTAPIGGNSTTGGSAAAATGGTSTSGGDSTSGLPQTAGASSMNGGGGAASAALDPQVPPADAAMMAEWLKGWTANNWEQEWVCEAAATPKTDGAPEIHAHTGMNRVCSNKVLAAAAAGSVLPVGAAAVKFVGEMIFVEVKVAAASGAGEGWYWYGPGGMPEGTGVAMCTGCHSAAGADADHPGFGDFVYFQVAEASAPGGLDPQVPPADAAMMVEWLKGWTANNWEQEWVCEAAATPKTDGAPEIHAHTGMNRVCSNKVLAAAAAGSVLPVGAAAVKFVGEMIFVEVKVAAASGAGEGWYWYGPGGMPEGTGVAMCTGCHSAAGADADHPGFGDFVYFQVTQ